MKQPSNANAGHADTERFIQTHAVSEDDVVELPEDRPHKDASSAKSDEITFWPLRELTLRSLRALQKRQKIKQLSLPLMITVGSHKSIAEKLSSFNPRYDKNRAQIYRKYKDANAILVGSKVDLYHEGPGRQVQWDEGPYPVPAYSVVFYQIL